jgi:SAM-dependent methyltransferase
MDGQRDTARDYYSEKLQRHGTSARGVDWPSVASQYLRFVQLLKICDFGQPFSLNDFGCGYGALLEYFKYRHPDASVDYHGVDVSRSMIEAAQRLWQDATRANFSIGSACRHVADYSLASGVFNVKLHWPTDAWEDYIESILRDLRANSRRGFSVNFMLPLDQPSDEQSLYRTRPDRWIDFLKELDCSPEPLSDYGLREFTLLVRIPLNRDS